MDLLLELQDDACFMGLVNADRYPAFLHPDTDFEALQQQIQQHSKRGSILVWGTSLPNHWCIRITDQPSSAPARRQLEGTLEVTDGGLYLVNYQHLLDAAQYEDDPIDAPFRKRYRIPLPNGHYKVHVRQLFDVEQDAIPEEFLGFELVLQPLSTSPKPSFNSDWVPIPWSIY